MFGKYSKKREEREEQKKTEHLKKIMSETKGSEELASTGFSMITSAIGARKLDSHKDRITRYYSDLAILSEDINFLDSALLNAYLADFSAGLIVILAEHLGISEEDCLQQLALALEENKGFGL